MCVKEGRRVNYSSVVGDCLLSPAVSGSVWPCLQGARWSSWQAGVLWPVEGLRPQVLLHQHLAVSKQPAVH